MPLFRKILCPIDFDQNSFRALGIAAELARERKAKLNPGSALSGLDD